MTALSELSVSPDKVRLSLNNIGKDVISDPVINEQINQAKTVVRAEADPSKSDTDLKNAIAAVAAYDCMAFDPDANARTVEEFDLRETYDPSVMETRTGKKAVRMLNAVRPAMRFEPI